MFRVELSEADIAEIKALVDVLGERYGSVEDVEFVRDAVVLAHDLPRELRVQLNRFRLEEPDALCVVAGYPIDDVRIGPTPPHWKDCVHSRVTLAEDLFFYLCACLLGEPIAWATQQNGRLMHDVFPIKAHQYEQLGSGSEELLTWHTEDAFHPMRTDYVGLFCLRNHDGIETTYASADDLELDPETAEVLRRVAFPIRPDRSHLPENRVVDGVDTETQRLLERSYAWVMGLDENPAPIPVLFGHPDRPYLRLDPYFMEQPGTAQEVDALKTIITDIDQRIGGYALRPGEILFLDNYRAVHGRKSFTARFDGTDRWLKRLNVTRDLRKSRERRRRAHSRVIY